MSVLPSEASREERDRRMEGGLWLVYTSPPPTLEPVLPPASSLHHTIVRRTVRQEIIGYYQLFGTLWYGFHYNREWIL